MKPSQARILGVSGFGIRGLRVAGSGFKGFGFRDYRVYSLRLGFSLSQLGQTRRGSVGVTQTGGMLAQYYARRAHRRV